MTSLTLHASGTATVEQAWERYAEFAQWPRWSPQITGVQADRDRIAAGATGRVRGPLGVSVTFRILAVDEAARTWTWRVRLGPVGLTLTHGVVADARGCRTWLTVDGPLPVVLTYAPLARLALGRLVTR